MARVSDEFLSGLVTRLEEMDAPLRDAGLAMGRAAGGVLYPLDLLALAALNRTLALSSGFRLMLQSRNFVCAGALLRLQLDTALRFAAAWLTPNPHEFSMSVMGGAQVRNLKDRTGKKMTDAHLVTCFKDDDPWIEDLYHHTSGYVHFSDKHFFSTVTGFNDDGALSMKASAVDEAVTPEHYIEAVLAFERCIAMLVRFLEGWTLTKDAGSAEEASRRLGDDPDA